MHHPLQPFGSLHRNDPRIIVAEARIVAEKTTDGPLHLDAQLSLTVGVYEQVIGSHAGLSGIQQFSPNDPSGGQRDIRIPSDDARAFSAKLQRQRRQMFGRGPHHRLSERRSARKKNRIETLFQHLFDDLGPSLQKRHVTGRKNLADQSFQQRLGMRNQRRGLQHGAVAGRQGADQRIQQQLHRVVPRRDDQHHAQRLGHDAASGRQERQRRRHASPGRPALQAAKMAGDLLQYDSDLGQVTFRRRLMQIQPQRLAQSVRMIP